MLGEPPRTQADLNFSLLGFPVRIHPMFWLISAVMGPIRSDAATVATWIVAVLLSILVHELGHALAMRAYGFNPWIVLHGFGGLTCCDPRQASGSRGSGSLGQVFISAAGPAAGFLLIGLLLLGCVLAGHGQDIGFGGPWGIVPVVDLTNARLDLLFRFISFICVFWGLVNLLPIYPLDGGQIARELWLKVSPQDGIRQSLLMSIVAAGAVAVFALSRQYWFTAAFFGYLGYSSYSTLEAYSGREPW